MDYSVITQAARLAHAALNGNHPLYLEIDGNTLNIVTPLGCHKVDLSVAVVTDIAPTYTDKVPVSLLAPLTDNLTVTVRGNHHIAGGA